MTGEDEKIRLFTKAGVPVRIFLMNSAIFIFIGIWLSGPEEVHWFIYFVPGVFALASVLGICPGLNLWRITLNRR